MRRVWGIYFMRLLGKPMTRLAAFSVIVIAITSSVSMPNVIKNALASSDFLRFSFSAVAHTSNTIQLGVLLAGLLVIWTMVDAFSAPSSAHVPV